MKEPTYQDTDRISFGQYSGKMLQDVPAHYLHWWFTQTERRDVRLSNYIENNIVALKQEYPDGIWT